MAGISCMLMRGGTSKGAYFLATDLPSDAAERDDLLLRIMGSPDPRQIDGIGGAHPLTSKVAVVSRSDSPDADLDYLFLQLGVEAATVSAAQNCGNLLAGVGPFAVERGLVDRTEVRIRMVNSGSIATARWPCSPAAIDGVPGKAPGIELNFEGTAGSFTGSLLPTGNVRDVVDGIEVTCVDNGMPVVVASADDLGITGYESHVDLAADSALLERIQSLRLAAGALMGVNGASVPKTTLVAPPRDGGTLCTRTFIPVKPHTSIGVLGAISAMTAALINGGVAQRFAVLPPRGHRLDVEHATGHLPIDLELDTTTHPPTVVRAGNVRTARKLFDGLVFPRP